MRRQLCAASEGAVAIRKSVVPFSLKKSTGERYCVTLEDFEKLRYIFTWKDSDIEGNGYSGKSDEALRKGPVF